MLGLSNARERLAPRRLHQYLDFIVSSQDMAELLDARRNRGKALAALEDWSTTAAKRATPAAAELTDEEVNRLVRDA